MPTYSTDTAGPRYGNSGDTYFTHEKWSIRYDIISCRFWSIKLLLELIESWLSKKVKVRSNCIPNVCLCISSGKPRFSIWGGQTLFFLEQKQYCSTPKLVKIARIHKPTSKGFMRFPIQIWNQHYLNLIVCLSVQQNTSWVLPASSNIDMHTT